MPSEVGPLSSGVYQLQRLVAESAAFRARVAIADVTAAKAKVKIFEYEADAATIANERPYACVWPGEKLDLAAVSGGANTLFRPSGELVLILTDNDRHPGEREASAADFVGWVDQVLLDILAAAGVDDRMTIRHVSLAARPARTPTKDEASAGAFWDVVWVVHWE
jgi:hypothetical protein